jgi:hypothetical protein
MPRKPNAPRDERKQQLDRFKEAARALECDDDPKAFKKLIGKIVKAKSRQSDQG